MQKAKLSLISCTQGRYHFEILEILLRRVRDIYLSPYNYRPYNIFIFRNYSYVRNVTLVIASKETGLEVNAEKTKYMFMS